MGRDDGPKTTTAAVPGTVGFTLCPYAPSGTSSTPIYGNVLCCSA